VLIEIKARGQLYLYLLPFINDFYLDISVSSTVEEFFLYVLKDLSKEI